MTQKIYTKEELEELESWFRKYELPQSLQLDKATYIPDLENTLSYLYGQAEICRENPKMQGAILLLERIRKKLEDQGSRAKAT